jgi:CheY-like chemotaxis protein
MPHVITVVDDLMFHSRIREAARGAGVEIRSARTPGDLVEAVRAGGRLVLVDADSSRLPWAEAVRAMRAEASLAAVPVVAFLSHVHVERAEAARAAGATRVLARGAFVQELPRLLAAAAAPATVSEENDC